MGRNKINDGKTANTYTQIQVQAVFAVQNRECIIQGDWKDELCKYIAGIVQNNKHTLLAINGMPDHIHILFGLRPSQIYQRNVFMAGLPAMGQFGPQAGRT